MKAKKGRGAQGGDGGSGRESSEGEKVREGGEITGEDQTQKAFIASLTCRMMKRR